MIIKNALVFTLNRGFVKEDVFIKDNVFTSKINYMKETALPQDNPENQHSNSSDVIDGEGCYLIPGLVDVHFHGCIGYDFSDGEQESLKKIGKYEVENGITSICPATMTLPVDKLEKICKNAYEYSKNNDKNLSRLCGIHLEGPFISKEKKGAQNPEFITNPDIKTVERLYEESGGLVKLITIAPELQGSIEFIKSLSDKIHISVGHTTSDYQTASKAFKLGADHVTHMYNAMPCLLHRESGVIGAAFDNPHVMTEIICDGIHIQDTVIRMTFSMFSKERIILVSDSMMATGMNDGEYELGGQKVFVKGKLATLKDGVIAGSATNLMDCMKKAVSMGISLEDSVRCASYNPAKSIGLDSIIGSIEKGKLADCVLLSISDLSIKKVILNGKIVD